MFEKALGKMGFSFKRHGLAGRVVEGNRKYFIQTPNRL
jgi:hypothetical protein